MNKSISVALLVGGVVLIVLGVRAYESFGSDVSRIVNDAPTDKAIWLLVGGVVVALAGLFGVLRGRTAG